MDCEARKPKPSCEQVKPCPVPKKKPKCLPPCPPKPSAWSKFVQSCGPKKDCWFAVGFVLFPHIGGVRSAVTIKENINWYDGLVKPGWGPPSGIFAPVWTVLYTTMGYASFLVWRDGGGFCYGRAKVPLLLYGTQLALNWAWPFVFFKTRNIGGALATATALWFFAASTAYTFCPINQCAGYLMIPYLLFVTWAAAINFAIWQNNEEGAAEEPTKPPGSMPPSMPPTMAPGDKPMPTYPPATYPPATYPPATYPPPTYPPATYPPATYPPATYPMATYAAPPATPPPY